jgi:diguanylate cyclase
MRIDCVHIFSSSMTPNFPTHLDEQFPGLDTAAALQLLARSGHSLPELAQVGHTVWLQALLNALCDLSSRDPLTGLANRRQFDLSLAREVDRVTRVGEPALVLMVDIDFLKQVNDTCGHAVGDLVIQGVATALADSVRPMDTVARLGGDEFAVIVPSCRPAFGKNVAERIRTKVAQTLVKLPSKAKLPFTVSMGGAFAPPWVRSSALKWVERADKQLYRAKAQGRNHVCLEEPIATLTEDQKRAVAQDFSLSGY